MHHCNDGYSWHMAGEQVKKFFLFTILVITLMVFAIKFVMDAIVELEDDE